MTVNFPRSRFDGSDDYISFASPGASYGVTTTQTLTFAMRMKFNSGQYTGRLWRRGPNSGNSVSLHCNGNANQLTFSALGAANANIVNVTSNITYPFSTQTIAVNGASSIISGNFTVGEIVNSPNSGASGTVVSWSNPNLVVNKVTGRWGIEQGITGATSGASSTSMGVTTLSAVNLVTVMVSLNLSTSTIQMYFDDTNAINGVTPTFNTGNGPISLNTAGLPETFGAQNDGTNKSAMDWEMIWCAPVFIDLSVQGNRDKFKANNIGPVGEGVTGTSPPVFIVGEKERINLATRTGLPINRGTGGTATKTGMLDQAGAQAWPPALELSAAVQTAGPYKRDAAISFLVSTNGYGSAFNITPTASGPGTWTVTPGLVPAGAASKVLTFTPTATGSYTFSFANSGGHVDPTPITLSVVSSFATIPANTTIQLTAAQLATLQIVCTDETLGAKAGVTLRWKTGAGETGATAGIDLSPTVIAAQTAQVQTISTQALSSLLSSLPNSTTFTLTVSEDSKVDIQYTV